MVRLVAEATKASLMASHLWVQEMRASQLTGSQRRTAVRLGGDILGQRTYIACGLTPSNAIVRIYRIEQMTSNT
jgi:hypothetical protein